MSPVAISGIVAVLVVVVVALATRRRLRRRHHLEFSGALRTLGEARTRKPVHVQAQSDDRAGTGRGVTVVDDRQEQGRDSGAL